MRPKAPHDPAIKLVEEPAGMGLEVRLAAVTLLERREGQTQGVVERIGFVLPGEECEGLDAFVEG